MFFCVFGLQVRLAARNSAMEPWLDCGARQVQATAGHATGSHCDPGWQR